MATTAGSPVYLEVARRRTFACSLKWPGWARSGRTEEAAMDALIAYAPRYAPVARRARVAFGREATGALEVVERVEGNATTEFGAPGVVPQADYSPLDRAEARRLAALVEAAWATLAEVAAAAPAVLRKGPRGGGRDRDPMVAHVIEAERAYARKLGIRQPGSDLRAEISDTLRGSFGSPATEAGRWPPRYAARRIAWHALDHAWEMEDRSEGAGMRGG